MGPLLSLTVGTSFLGDAQGFSPRALLTQDILASVNKGHFPLASPILVCVTLHIVALSTLV